MAQPRPRHAPNRAPWLNPELVADSLRELHDRLRGWMPLSSLGRDGRLALRPALTVLFATIVAVGVTQSFLGDVDPALTTGGQNEGVLTGGGGPSTRSVDASDSPAPSSAAHATTSPSSSPAPSATPVPAAAPIAVPAPAASPQPRPPVTQPTPPPAPATPATPPPTSAPTPPPTSAPTPPPTSAPTPTPAETSAPTPSPLEPTPTPTPTATPSPAECGLPPLPICPPVLPP